MRASNRRPRRAPGRFLVLEGLDGAGTTTQTQRLTDALRAQGLRVLKTHEPSAGPIGTQIRQVLKGRLGLGGGEPLTPATLALLFAADRLDHLASEIEPALARGEWVVCDRYVLSSIAYQGASLPQEWIEAINTGATAPDLTLYLEVPVAMATARRAARGGDAELFDDDGQQRLIRRSYERAIESREGNERIVRVDGTGTPEAVAQRTLEAVRSLL